MDDSDYQRRLAEAFTDDITWLSLGKDLLEKTIPTLNDQAKALGTSVGWFWTVYTATTVAATTALGSMVNWLLVSPILTTLLAYVFVVISQSPVLDSVDLRSPDDIRRAIERSLRTKVRWMRASILTLALTAALIGAGVVIQLG
jgi:hypothetical protein